MKSYTYYMYTHLDDEFYKDVPEIEKSIENKDWKSFKKYYQKWKTKDEYFVYLPNTIKVYDEDSMDVYDIPLTKENFTLIDSFDHECG